MKIACDRRVSKQADRRGGSLKRWICFCCAISANGGPMPTDTLTAPAATTDTFPINGTDYIEF